MADDDREHPITWEQAKELISAHRSTTSFTVAGVSDGAFGGAFKKKDVLKILAQNDCSFLRVYYGRHADGSPALILLGVDGAQADMSGGVVLDNHFPCPPMCPSGGEKL